MSTAQIEIEHEIESKFENCIGITNGNTIAILNCTNTYILTWDSILNYEYQLLVTKMTKSDASRF